MLQDLWRCSGPAWTRLGAVPPLGMEWDELGAPSNPTHSAVPSSCHTSGVPPGSPGGTASPTELGSSALPSPHPFSTTQRELREVGMEKENKQRIFLLEKKNKKQRIPIPPARQRFGLNIQKRDFHLSKPSPAGNVPTGSGAGAGAG